MYRYTAAGYCDWVDYQTESDFLMGISSYLGGNQKNFLELSGIDVGRVLLAIVKEVESKGVIEELV